jgi:hypothetical protein
VKLVGVIEYVEHVFDGIDHASARCPRHPDQLLVAEIEYLGDLQFVCPLFDYRAIMRDPGMHGLTASKWEAPNGARDWTPPLRRV